MCLIFEQVKNSCIRRHRVPSCLMGATVFLTRVGVTGELTLNVLRFEKAGAKAS